jgi:hypothetical protein
LELESLIHARYVLHNLRVCDPVNNNKWVADIPQALEALYGVVFANFMAKNSVGLTLTPEPISPRRENALFTLKRMCVEYPIDMELPSRLLPWPSLVGAVVIPAGTSRMAVRGPENSTTLSTAGRQAYSTSHDCNANSLPGTWYSREYKLSGLVSIEQVGRVRASPFLRAAALGGRRVHR